MNKRGSRLREFLLICWHSVATDDDAGLQQCSKLGDWLCSGCSTCPSLVHYVYLGPAYLDPMFSNVTENRKGQKKSVASFRARLIKPSTRNIEKSPV